jgi:hypothetical protein
MNEQNAASTKTRLMVIATTAMIVSGLSAVSLGNLVQNAFANTCGEGDLHRDCVDGRITGGGKLTPTSMTLNRSGATKVTHGFELYCNINDGPNNLEINWFDKDGNENHFHLTSLISATDSIVCYDDPALKQKPPVAPLDTYEARGTGKLNNVDGATIYFVLKDAGEPGSDDSAHFFIADADGNEVLAVVGTLDQGNHQAHKVN